MKTLTARQVEELAIRVLGRVDKLRNRSLNGDFRSIHNAGHSGLLNRLIDADLLTPRGVIGVPSLKLTVTGCDALEANLSKLPVIDPTLGVTLDDIRAAIASRRAELLEAQEAARRAFDEAKAAVRAKRAETERRIPGKLRELVEEAGFELADGMARSANENERLVALWRAIVDADASL